MLDFRFSWQRLLMVRFSICSSVFLLELNLEPECGSDIFLQNFEISPEYTELQHPRPYRSDFGNIRQHKSKRAI
jgi:hypothetical protein